MTLDIVAIVISIIKFNGCYYRYYQAISQG